MTTPVPDPQLDAFGSVVLDASGYGWSSFSRKASGPGP